MEAYKPTDATTNPSLILSAAQQEQYQHLIERAVKHGNKHGKYVPLSSFFHKTIFFLNKLSLSILRTKDEKLSEALDYICVLFGVEILKIVPGRVSTEVDARLSFDTNASVEEALKLIGLYEELGVDRKRILIKLASTWEGIQAARYLSTKPILHSTKIINKIDDLVSHDLHFSFAKDFGKRARSSLQLDPSVLIRSGCRLC